MRCDRTRAFTLIELLVVVAIIVALLAILLPSLGRAVEIANRAVCASQQHQIGLASLTYIAENDRMLPPCVVDQGLVTQESWDGWLGASLGIDAPQPAAGGAGGGPVDPGADLFTCPTDDRLRNFGRRRSYSRVLPNVNTYFADWSRIFFNPQRIGDITPTPGSTAYISEWHSRSNVRRMNWPGNFIGSGSYINGWPSYLAAGEAPPAVINHAGEGSNFMFYDMHVQWLSVAEAEPLNAAHWPQP